MQTRLCPHFQTPPFCSSSTQGYHQRTGSSCRHASPAVFPCRHCLSSQLWLTFADCLQAIYCVHPTSTLKGWLVTLRIREPEVYAAHKVIFCEVLSHLHRYCPQDDLPEMPLHVLDKDRKRLAQLRP